jgi:hypothetical protein
MFASTQKLHTVPRYDTSSATSFANMFSGSAGISHVPLFDTSAGTNFSNMFLDATRIRTVPLFDTSIATNFSSLFSGCTSLREVPQFDTSAVLTADNMIRNCRSLQECPSFDFSAATALNSFANGANSLRVAPMLKLGAGLTTVNSMYNSCTQLVIVPTYTVPATADVASIFSSCRSIRSARWNGTGQTVSYASLQLDAEALNEIYRGLATVTSKTITVSSCPGASGDNPTIATAKGWTVTG